MTLVGISASYTDTRSLLSRLTGAGSRTTQNMTSLTGNAAGSLDSGERAKAEASTARDNAEAARKARAAQRLEDIKAQLAILKRSSLSPQSLARLAGELASQLASVAQDLGGNGLDLPTATGQTSGEGATLGATLGATAPAQSDLSDLAVLPDGYREALETGDPLSGTDSTNQSLLQQAQALMQELQALMRRGGETGSQREKRPLASPVSTSETIFIL